MKNKLLIYMLLCMLCIICLTGCANAIPEMTDEELRMVEEYAAQLILKYDKNHQTSVLTEEERQAQIAKLEQQAELEILVQEERERQEAAAQNNQNDAGSSEDGNLSDSETGESGDNVYVPAYTDIDEFLELSSYVNIEYSNYIITATYPQNSELNDWQGVTTATGSNTLVAFEYTVENVSGADYTLDMASLDKRFSFKINGNITKTAITTLLANDLSYYRDVIPAGEKVTAVLIIEIDPDVAAQMQTVDMILKYNGNRSELTLL